MHHKKLSSSICRFSSSFLFDIGIIHHLIQWQPRYRLWATHVQSSETNFEKLFTCPTGHQYGSSQPTFLRKEGCFSALINSELNGVCFNLKLQSDSQSQECEFPTCTWRQVAIWMPHQPWDFSFHQFDFGLVVLWVMTGQEQPVCALMHALPWPHHF